jgi:D-sedoheptulose 7-phosphate isomerase
MNQNNRAHLVNYLNLNASTIKEIKYNEILDLQHLVWHTIENDHVIFTAGNGGSYSTASHAVCDFGKGINTLANKQLRVSCLLDSVPTLTAWSNDDSYDQALGKILNLQQRKGDVLLLISGSGNSRNLIHAAEVAKKVGNKVISLVGFDGGILKQISDLAVHVPSNDMQIVENMHLLIIHYIFQSTSELAIKSGKKN